MGLAGFGRLREVVTLVAAFLALAGAPAGVAQGVSLEELISGVVRIKAFINPEGRSVRNLGREREGSGVVIDSAGLVVTIGYLMVEAHAVEVQSNDGRTVPAEVVGYDHASGFGLVRTLAPLKVRPLALGKSEDLKERTPLLIASYGGVSRVLPVELIAKREYAGSWEYLLDQAIFTAPAHPAWSGAALINSRGELVGIGSLILGDVSGKGDGVAGNMFVPIELLPPILGDLISLGRVSGPVRPWLGLTTEEARGRVVVSRVVPGGPAEKAGMRRGDVIVGVAGAEPKTLADFYRKVWAVGEAGVTVPLDVRHGGETRRVEIKSMDRLDHLRLKSSF
ncbi:MAG TPA: S1C family serine protease [Xanthobacteraceae bacterium]|nr:S1C family serine protease [Xanthobacteraceae bacterium]